MSDLDSDQAFDAELRSVPIPAGLTERLCGIAAWTDAELDHALIDVPVPRRLCVGLRLVAADCDVEEQLCEVAISPRVLAKVRNIPHLRRRSRVGRFALALSLLLLLGIAQMGSMTGVLLSLRPQEPTPADVVLIDRGPLKLSSPPPQAVTIVPGPELASGDGTALAQDETRAIWPMLHLLHHQVEGPAGELFREMQTGWDPWENWMRKRWSVLGYADTQSPVVPDMEAIPMPRVRGVAADLARNFDRDFLYRLGSQPPVALSSSSPQGPIAVPMATSTGSFVQAKRAVTERSLPEPRDIHVEDFLHAVACPFPPAPPGELAIRTAAGPSIFNPSRAGLLLVGAVGGETPVRAVRKTHLVVALDISASMGWDHRLETACSALLEVLLDFGPGDRLSLVIFNEAAAEVADEVSRDDAAAVMSLLDGISPAGGADVAAGLEQAIAAAIETASDPALARRLVLLSDSRQTLDEQVMLRLQAMMHEAQQNDFRMEVLDLSGQAGQNASLAILAEQTGGAVRRAATADDLHWAMTGTLTGSPVVLARHVKLEMEFNPKAVAAYRLIGHESTDIGGLMPAAMRADLHVGEQANSLFEVWLYPNDVDDVAVVSLEWINPEDGKRIRLPDQRISRLQFATSFEASPLALQAAAIAAETGEVLRQGFNFDIPTTGSYEYAPKTHQLRAVLDAAREVNPRLSQRLEYQRFVDFIESATLVDASRRPGLAKSGRRAMIGGQWREIRE